MLAGLSDALVQLRAVELQQRCLVVRDQASRLETGHPIGEHPRHLHLHHAVRQLIAQHLVDLQGAGVVRGVIAREVHQRLHRLLHADRRADRRALEVERRNGGVPAPVLLADDVLFRYAHVIEEHLVELVGAGHVHQRLHRDARRLHIQDEVGNPLVLGRVRVGAGEQDHPLGHMRQRGPDLLAVEDVVVTVAHGFRLERGQIRTGLRLAVALAPNVFAGEHAGQVFLLLLVCAVDDDRRARHPQPDDQVQRTRRSMERHLLVEDELLHHRHVRTAILLRPGGGDPALVRKLLEPDLVPVPVGDERLLAAHAPL